MRFCSEHILSSVLHAYFEVLFTDVANAACSRRNQYTARQFPLMFIVNTAVS